MTDYMKMAEAHGLGWDVQKVVLQTPDGEESGFFGVQREDTGKVFCTVRDGYKPFQNSELFELADAVANETNLPVHKAGMFDDGGKVFIQLNTGSLTGIGSNNDTVQTYVTCVNSHDGSSAIRWGHSNLTISCSNTFHAVRGKLSNSSRHTEKMHERIKISLNQIRLVRDAQDRLNEKLYELSEHSIGDNDIDKFLSNITGLPMNLTEDELRGKFHGRAVNRALDIENAVKDELSYKGNNLWALFNGVTKYTTHVYGRTGTREHSKMLGQAASLDERALDLVTNMM